MIKCLSIADIHLTGGQETEEAQALLKAAGVAIKENVDVVLVNGDVYHAKSTPEQRMVFKEFLGAFCLTGIKVVVLRGNHDESMDLSIFDNPKEGVWVFERPETVHLGCRGGTLTVHALPHFNGGALALNADSLADVGETGTGIYDQLIHQVFNSVRTSDNASIVAFHGTVTDSHLDNGMIPKHDGVVLNGPLLASIGCPVRGGHYHAAQEPHPNVRYSGSITLRNYGESGDKGVLIDTFEGGKWQRCEFVSLDPSPRITVEAEWSPDAFDFLIGIGGRTGALDCIDPDSVTNARVRFRYKVRQSEIPMINLEPVRRFFEDAGVRELKFERDLIIESAIRSETIQQASTVLDMHLSWLELRGLDTHKPAQEALYNQIVKGEEQKIETTIA